MHYRLLIETHITCSGLTQYECGMYNTDITVQLFVACNAHVEYNAAIILHSY